MKLLIIEDNPRLASLIKKQLSQWFIVETAATGDEGLRLASTSHFDIALLDLGLPDTPGIDVCKQLRKLSNDLPILVVSNLRLRSLRHALVLPLNRHQLSTLPRV